MPTATGGRLYLAELLLDYI